ncbi:MAG: TIGR03032 family protein [Methylovulum sp.]|jgi:uncharacterized protein (TIGR03032 family)
MSDEPQNESIDYTLTDEATLPEMPTVENESPNANKPQLFPSPQFAEWLAHTGGSIAFSTYQSGRLFLLGSSADGSLYAQERTVGTAMGLAINEKKLWIGCRDQIWCFVNTGPVRLHKQNYGALYLPRVGHMIGQSNTHDVLIDATFKGVTYDFLYANTQFSCISTLDSTYNFRPIWRPDFISELKAEDRCHLNGICAQEGELAYATICGQYDTQLGWKAHQTGSGLIMDVRTNEVVCTGLSMPHSPRWYNGKLWVLNSGEGELGYVDFTTRRFVAVAQCAGFARGLAFIGDYAVVALSRLRLSKEGILNNINLSQRLQDRNTFQRCGLQVFDLKSNTLKHWLHISGVVTELYDVVYLPNIARPYTTGFNEPKLNLKRVIFPQI